MAAKVNTKFVIMVAVGAAAVFGALYVAYAKLVENTPERLVAAGDAQLKTAAQLRTAGDEKKAEEAVVKAIVFYSKAVNKEQTNVELLKKWDAALKEYAPTDKGVYEKAFTTDYMMIRRQTAILLRTDVPAHRAYLDILFKQTNNASISPEMVIRTTEESLAYFDQATDEAEKAKRDGVLRYRGIARARQAMKGNDAPMALIDDAKKDLEAALRFDPKDESAAEMLYAVALLESDRLASQGKNDEAAAAKKFAEDSAARFLAANPSNPLITLVLARNAWAEQVQEIRKLPTREEREAAMPGFRSKLTPALENTAQAMEAADAKSMEPVLLQSLAQLEGTIDPTAKLRRTLTLSKKLAAARPDDPEVALLAAGFAAQAGEFELAITEAQRVTKAAVKPISLEGMSLFGFRRAAAGQIASWAMDMVETESDDAARAKALTRAKELRDAFAKYAEESDAQLKFVNGRISLAESQLNEKEREGLVREAGLLFKEYNDKVGDSDVRGLLYAAVAGMSRANPDTGYAKERLQKVLSLEPENLVAMVQLARVELVNQNPAAADALLDQVLARDPENTPAKEIKASIKGDGLDVKDPAAAAIVAAIRKGTPDNQQIVAEELRRVVEKYPEDSRSHLSLARQLLVTGDREGAAAAIDAGLKAKPDDVALKQFKSVLASKGRTSLELELELIQQSGAPRLSQLIRRHMAFSKYGKATEANAELETAEREFPESPEVVETRFLAALTAGQWDVANAKMDIAIAKNMDSANGLTFRARLQVARGQVTEAIASAEEAIRRVPANSEMYRLLGKLLRLRGRMNESVEAFRQAVEARPTDPVATKEYVQALLEVNRFQDALDQCRKNPKIANSDDELANLWLELEWQGGDRKKALEGRTQIHKTQPDMRSNTLALARMHVEEGRHAEAQPLIAELKKQSDSLDVASIEAMSLDMQGKGEEARGIYRKLIASTDNAVSVAASAILANYMASRGDVENAIKVLEDARPKQDPKTANVDQAMAQFFDRLGQKEKAIEAARRVIAATGDADGGLRKEIVRTYLRLGKFDEADAEYAGLVSLEAKDVELLLLKADTKLARGDQATARAILDDAVARFSQTERPYNVRGSFFLTVTRQYREAVADFTKSLSINALQPGVLTQMARAYVAMQMPNEALAALEKLALMAPGNESARRTWVANLLDLGRKDAAMEASLELLKLNNGNAAVARDFGLLFAEYGHWPESSRLHQLAYGKDKSTDSAALLVSSMLKEQPQRLAEAGVVIREVSDQTENHWPMLLARARWQAQQTDKVGARASLTKALTLIGDKNLDQLRNWYQVVLEVVTEQREQVAYFDQLERAGTTAPYPKWFRATVQFKDQATQAKAIDELKSFADPSMPEGLRITNFRMTTGLLFSIKRTDEAIAYCRLGLEQFPNDGELLNNAAYILAKEMGQTEEALPLAEKAVQVAPGSADAYDTLGYVQFLAKKYPEAKQSLLQAYNLAGSSNSFRALLISLIHLGQVQAAMGEKDAALNTLREAQNWALQVPIIAREFEAEMAELVKATQ
jgi:tetratricopeptide (TPR) repeat protein